MLGDGARRAPACVRLVRERVFYGWIVTLGCTALTFVVVGVGYYGQSVFLKPLRTEHHWSSAIVNGASALYFAVSGFAALAVGRRIDRRGALPYLTAGTILTGVSVCFVGFVHAVWQLYLVYASMAIAY